MNNVCLNALNSCSFQSVPSVADRVSRPLPRHIAVPNKNCLKYQDPGNKIAFLKELHLGPNENIFKGVYDREIQRTLSHSNPPSKFMSVLRPVRYQHWIVPKILPNLSNNISSI